MTDLIQALNNIKNDIFELDTIYLVAKIIKDFENKDIKKITNLLTKLHNINVLDKFYIINHDLDELPLIINDKSYIISITKTKDEYLFKVDRGIVKENLFKMNGNIDLNQTLMNFYIDNKLLNLDKEDKYLNDSFLALNNYYKKRINELNNKIIILFLFVLLFLIYCLNFDGSALG